MDHNIDFKSLTSFLQSVGPTNQQQNGQTYNQTNNPTSIRPYNTQQLPANIAPVGNQYQQQNNQYQQNYQQQNNQYQQQNNQYQQNYQQQNNNAPPVFVIDPEQIRFAPVFSTTRGLGLYELIMTRHPPSWSKFFLSVEREVRHACSKIEEKSNISGKSFYPFIPNVLAAFWLTPLFMLKAVIIGQDPYPQLSRSGMPFAIGACFASDRNNEIPKSLMTVYGELEASVEDWKNPGHPDIRPWGRRGVLLLNAALTVESNAVKSHVGFWTPFAEKLMDFINTECNNVVFLLWGKDAQKTAGIIYESRHKKLIAYHPSPEAENRGYMFKGCNHFNLANEYLVEKGIHPIDWRIE